MAEFSEFPEKNESTGSTAETVSRASALGAKAWDIFEKIVRAVVGGALRLVGRELTEEQWAAFLQFVKFALVGASNTLISYVVHCVVYRLCGNYYVASAAGFVISVLNSFYWNNKYVFRANRTTAKEILLTLLKTFACYSLTGIVLNWALLRLLCDRFGMSAYVAPLLILVVTIPLNFLLNKFWAFADKNNKKDKPSEKDG